MLRDDIQFILWLDLETTGSDETQDEIVEVGCILTDLNLQELGEFQAVVRPSPAGMQRLLDNAVVHEMHKQNGLLADMQDPAVAKDLAAVTRELMTWLESFGVRPHRAALAGSGVGHFDSKFLRRFMPQLARHLRYWVLDIGTVRRFHELFLGSALSRANDRKAHRALADVRCHIEEATAFRGFFFRCAGGSMEGEPAPRL